jgi:hypothetical protein
MRAKENSRADKALSCGPIRLLAKPAFDPDCFLEAGFLGGDLALKNWPELWERWLSGSRLEIVPLPGRRLLLAALPLCAEEETDAQFCASAFLGYAHDVLARTLCRDLLRAALKQMNIEYAPCAPFPRLSPAEQPALVRLGILAPGRPSPMLLRRYAILTPHPPGEGCLACALAAACPKRPWSFSA